MTLLPSTGPMREASARRKTRNQFIETTHVYLEVDLLHKEQALQKLAAVEGDIARFRADDPLLAFLTLL